MVAFLVPPEIGCLTTDRCDSQQSNDVEFWRGSLSCTDQSPVGLSCTRNEDGLRTLLAPLWKFLFQGPYADSWSMFSSIGMRYYILFGAVYFWTFHCGRMALSWLVGVASKVNATSGRRALYIRIGAAVGLVSVELYQAALLGPHVYDRMQENYMGMYTPAMMPTLGVLVLLMLAVLLLLVAVGGDPRPPKIIRIAGSTTLGCYISHMYFTIILSLTATTIRSLPERLGNAAGLSAQLLFLFGLPLIYQFTLGIVFHKLLMWEMKYFFGALGQLYTRFKPKAKSPSKAVGNMAGAPLTAGPCPFVTRADVGEKLTEVGVGAMCVPCSASGLSGASPVNQESMLAHQSASSKLRGSSAEKTEKRPSHLDEDDAIMEPQASAAQHVSQVEGERSHRGDKDRPPTQRVTTSSNLLARAESRGRLLQTPGASPQKNADASASKPSYRDLHPLPMEADEMSPTMSPMCTRLLPTESALDETPALAIEESLMRDSVRLALGGIVLTDSPSRESSAVSLEQSLSRESVRMALEGTVLTGSPGRQSATGLNAKPVHSRGRVIV